MQGPSRRWTWTALGIVALLVPRLLLGWMFGGTQDQLGYAYLWEVIESHGNPYTEMPGMYVWPPLWWILLAFYRGVWHLVAWGMPWLAFTLGPSYPIKLVYYAFEVALAILLARHVERAKRGNAPADRRPEVAARAACLFLLLPVTWVITALHGNFDVIPTFFTIAAFLLLAAEPSETSAIVAGGSIGLAVMARTFPVVFAGPLFIYVLRRNGWTTAVVASALTVLPSFLSMAPIYFLDPAAIQGALAYRGIPGGWWGLAVVARVAVSDQLALVVEAASYPVFYAAILALSVVIAVRLWRGRLGVFRAGALLATGMFCFAPTISSQNFYFLAPWAFWYASVQRQRAARVFLGVASAVLFFGYVVLPENPDQPTWFQTADSYSQQSHVRPPASPTWLVPACTWLTHVLGGDRFPYGLYMHLLGRIVLLGVVWYWFVALWRLPDRSDSMLTAASSTVSLRSP
jgi:hypothetical protein